MGHTFINLGNKECSAPGDSEKEQNPVEQGAGETPLIGEEYSSPGSIIRRTLRTWQRRPATSASTLLERTAVVLPKSKQGSLGLQRLLLGTLAAANLCLLHADGHRLQRSPVHMGLNMDKDFVRRNWNPRRARGVHRSQASDSGRPGHFRGRAG